MPRTINASNHAEWARNGLKDYGEFAERVTFCNQSAFGDGQLEGEWYFIDEKPLPDASRVIYVGSFGNDNAPGASMHTHATIFDGSDPDDLAEFTVRAQELEAQPEYVEDDFGDGE